MIHIRSRHYVYYAVTHIFLLWKENLDISKLKGEDFSTLPTICITHRRDFSAYVNSNVCLYLFMAVAVPDLFQFTGAIIVKY